jgi:FkbM family methyltransferase
VSALLRFVRRLAAAPLFRRLTSVGPLLRLSFSLRATLVRERARFVRNELRLRPVTATYRLRESGVAVTLRHHTGDVMVLDEIFSQREYELPDGIVLADGLTAIDLGANIGLFGAWLLGICPRARIVGYEPDPDNAALHRLAIEANDLEDRWRLVEAFAGTHDGTTRFTAGLHAVSHEGEGIEVPVVDVLPELLEADLVKIDIEGAEWPILADPRFGGLRAGTIVLEYHADRCPGPDPARSAEQALSAAGFEVLHTASKPEFGAGIIWGYRKAQSSPWPSEKRSERSNE